MKTPAMTLFIDVSDAQQLIDWNGVVLWIGPNGEKVEGSACKATEGNTGVDKQFVNNWNGILKSGLKARIAYHFADPDTWHPHDPEGEATHFFETVKAQGFRPGIDGLALDIEQARKIHAGPEFSNWTKIFCQTIATLSGQRPFIYTGGPFWNTESVGLDKETTEFFASHPLWFAAYVLASSINKFIPTPWHDVGFVLWQRSGDQCASDCTILRVGGIGNGKINVDRSELKGPIEDLQKVIAGTVLQISKTAPSPSPFDPGTEPNSEWHVEEDQTSALDKIKN